MLAMCAAYGVDPATFFYRLRNGMTVQEALAPRQRPRGKFTTDHTGRKCPSIRAMCEAWHVSVPAYNRRRERGISIEEALTVPLAPRVRQR